MVLKVLVQIFLWYGNQNHLVKLATTSIQIDDTMRKWYMKNKNFHSLAVVLVCRSSVELFGCRSQLLIYIWGIKPRASQRFRDIILVYGRHTEANIFLHWFLE